MTDDTAIRALAEHMAQECDVSVERADQALRNLMAKGLLRLEPPARFTKPPRLNPRSPADVL